jgi:PAS domain S-box-containing protein
MGPDEGAEPRADDRLSDWLVRASPDGLWVLDEEGRTNFANERMAEMLGVEHGDVVGFSVYDALDASDGEAFRAHLARLRDLEEPGADLECCLHARDGSDTWVQVTPRPLRDRSGSLRGWLHRVGENSAQRRQLEDFRRRKQQFTDAQRLARIGSWDWDLVNDRLTWSDGLFDIYGVDRNAFQVTQETFFEHVHPDDKGKVTEGFRDALRSGGEYAADFRFVPPGEVARWIRGRGVVLRDEAGAVVGVRGTSQDITESKDIENALSFLSVMGSAANEARTLADVLVAADAIIRPYAQWPAVLISVPTTPGSEELLHMDIEWGISSDEVRLAARDLATRSAAERRIIEATGPTGTVLVAGAVVATDRLACVLVSDTRRATFGSPFDLNVFSQILTMLGYVAEREWAATELAAVRDQALGASKAKSEFLATMSHEIRTPLNGVIGLSELLSSTDLTPHQRRLTAGVDQAGRTLLALVNDILDLSKIEAGRLDLEEVDFDPRRIIEQSAALVADQAREKHLELVISSAADVPAQVRGDPVRFGQIITNLVANAVKFTASGEVVIRATGTPGPLGSQVRVEVSDTGVGIAPEVKSRLFESFSQADSSTTREYGGTGLGLAISRRIVTAMEGEIGVDSEQGVGSTFWFTVALGHPLNDGPGRDEAREDAVRGLRVLIVDDNETNRFILTEQLASWQVGVKAVASAYEALVELDAATRSRAPYDIVLLDYMMPGADGEQLARIIRAETRHDHTRLALLSSAMEPSADFLGDAGIDLFLSKPVLPAQLLSTLATLGGRLDPAEDPPAPAAGSVATGRRGRVLVVEDNPVNQLVAEGVLERLGYSVVLVGDGAAGVAALAADMTGFDAILMDCQMPVMDGYDATKAIRAMASVGPRIPIIAMTAGAEAEERQRCLAAGMDDFLLKPVDVALLEATLDRWVPAPAELEVDRLSKTGAQQVETTTSAPSSGSPPAQSEEDAGVLNRGRLTELLETGAADLALLFRILDRFGSRARDAATELSNAVLADDDNEVARLAHGLRGSAANVGLVRLASMCEDIELNAQNGALPTAAALFVIEDEVAAGVVQLDSFARDMVREAAAAGGSLRRDEPVPSLR